VNLLLLIIGMVLALPVILLLGIMAGPAAIVLALLAGFGLLAGGVAWIYAHIGQR
jgi:hypothetical protein